MAGDGDLVANAAQWGSVLGGRVASGRAHAAKVSTAAALVGLIVACAPTALMAQEAGGDVQKQLNAQKDQIAALVAAVNTQKAEINALKATIKGRPEARRVQEPRRTVVVRERVAPPVIAGGPLLPVHSAYGPPPVGGTVGKSVELGGITITPGGYIAMEGVFRSKTTQSDINTSFTAIPTRNNLSSLTNELRLTERQSKAAVLVEGDITPTTEAAAYYEMDFQAATTNGSGSNNGYGVRFRHLYATVDFVDTGFHVLAGQAWSLITMNNKGITPRNEYIPPTIESNYVPGFLSQRVPQIRLTKDFDKTLWVALSAEAPQTTFQTGCNPIVTNVGAVVTPTSIPGTGVANVLCQSVGTGASFGGTGETTAYSLNHIPDVIGKVAYEGKLADHAIHLEGIGVYRNFYDAAQYTTALGAPTRQAALSTSGYGVGGGVIVSVIPKRLEISASGMIGRGLGRYSTAGFSDATIAPDGSVKPLFQTSFLAGMIYHAMPSLDIYANAGFEKQQASYASNGTLATPTNAAGYIGVGQPNANDTGCDIIGGTCLGNTHTIYQITGGLWDKLYDGRYGSLRGGLQYSYTNRQLFGSTNGPGGTFVRPSTDDHMVFTSLRYYPF